MTEEWKAKRDILKMDNDKRSGHSTTNKTVRRNLLKAVSKSAERNLYVGCVGRKHLMIIT
jgi:hypothetical protein